MFTVGIINYGMGNILSVFHAVEMVGGDPKICNAPEELLNVDKIILPGVGAFKSCMDNLESKGFLIGLHETVIRKGKPILGICLGMQVMAKLGFEGGEFKGLGWFNAEVIRLHPDNSALRVPHIGWNDIRYRKESPLFSGLTLHPEFYFVHSFSMKCKNENDVEATCEYGEVITAAIKKDNIFATQFHPEKSQDYGLKVLENFLKWKP